MATAKKTGRTIDCWGKRLAEIDQPLGEYDLVEVEGVHYYTFDLGGFGVGARTATSVDYGGNDARHAHSAAITPRHGSSANAWRSADQNPVR